jgi:dihydrofolate synthase / folylpolyglutamate synthase
MVFKGIDQHRWSLGLGRMQRALAALGHPEKAYPHILVAGTNGKGSTCIYLERMLLAAGKTVGTTLSPHVSRFTERFRINGREARLEEVGMVRAEAEPLVSGIDLTYFEWCVVIAAMLFRRLKVDFGIFEVGLGGRFDASNALDPAITLITGISLDHTDYLGDTITQIAREKAAIARSGRPLLTTATGRARQVIQAEARSVGADVRVITGSPLIPGTVTGTRQRLNASLAYEASVMLGADPGPGNLGHALKVTFLPGRIEKIGDRIIMDVAHNPSSMLVLVKHLKKCNFKGVGVVGILADKDYRALVALLKKACEHLYLAPVQSPRSWGFEQMKGFEGEDITICTTITEAFSRALETGRPLVITGSFYTVGEVRENLVCHGWPS